MGKEMKFDIPINISVTSENETKAEQRVLDFMVKAMKEFGVECDITDFEYFEFPVEESCNSRCGDINHEQRQSSHCEKQVCNNSSKGSGSCC